MRRLINWFNILIKKRKALKRWQRIVTVLAAVITFATTYALILPAITVEKDNTSEVAGMYLEKSTDGDGMQEENALEPVGISIAAEMENAVTFAYSDDDMTATAVFSTDEEIPEGTEFVVNLVTPESEEYADLRSRSEGLLDKEFIYDVTTCAFYDFALVCDNVDVTPKTGLVDIQIIFRNNTVEHVNDMLFAGRFARPAEEVDGFMTVAADVSSDQDISAAGNENAVFEDRANTEDELVAVNSDESSVIELTDGIITSLALKGTDLTRNDSIVGILAGNVDEETKAAAAETDAEIPDNDGTQEESEVSGSAETDDEEISTALPVKTLKSSGRDYTVTLSYDESSGIPDEAVLDVSEISQDLEEYQTYLKEAKKAMGLKEEETLPSFAARFFDIKIMVNDQEFTPESGVSVEITYNEPLAENPDTEVNAVHFADEKAEAEVIETNTAEVQEDGKATVEFTAESFSVYGVIYTVDFHWEVDGKTYDFSIPGGGFVSLEHLIEVLGITNDAETVAGNDEARSLNDVSVSDSTKKFVADVANIEFSNPNLVWVGKADADTTIGAMKAENQLIIDYSADLTEEQIAQLNAQMITSGDWAIISIHPFSSKETLSITMKNGDTFTVRVTDAQPISDSGQGVIDVNKSYLICYQVGSTYYLLKNDGSVDSSHNPSDFENLNSTYAWTFNYIFTEKDLPESLGYNYYLIRPVDNKSKTLSLNDPTSATNPLVQQGNNNVAVLPVGDDKFVLEGYRNIGTSENPQYYNLEFNNGQFVSAIGESAKVYIYEMDTLPTYDYTVRSSDEARGTVTVEGGDLQTVHHTDKPDTHYYNVTSSSSKINAGVITAVPNQHKNTELQSWQTGYDENKWEFDYWEQDGLRLDRDKYPASLPVGSLPIPFNGSNLVAHFKQNPKYVVPNSEKESSTIEDMESWMDSLKTRSIPLNESATTKTAEVYDYENRIYRVDIATKANFETFAGNMDMAFCLDVSNSMKFPSKLVEATTYYNNHTNPIPIYQINSHKTWLDTSRDYDNPYYLVADASGTATVFKIYYKDGSWKAQDASRPAETEKSFVIGTKFKTDWAGDGYNPFSAGDTNNSTYVIYDAYDQYNRFYYLNESIGTASEDLMDIRDLLKVAGAQSPNVRIAYNTFNKNLGTKTVNGRNVQEYQDFSPASKLSVDFTYAAGGGTRPDVAFKDLMRDDKYHWNATYNDETGQTNRYVILVTDGAPQGRLDGDPENPTSQYYIDQVEQAARNLKSDSHVKLITIGLSLDKVEKGKQLLYNIADNDKNGNKMFYLAESANDLTNIFRQVIETLMEDAIVYTDVSDTIGDAFYPVDKLTGAELTPGQQIDIEGRATTDSTRAVGTVVLESGKTKIKWNHQAVDQVNGWHGVVYVKAKEDLIGGNAVKTNGAASVTATSYTAGGQETSFATSGVRPELHLNQDLPSPRVNVNELTFTSANTEWTVQVGTGVDPKEQLKQLFDEIQVLEVLNKDGTLHYELSPNSITDNRENTGDEHGIPETFFLAPVILERMATEGGSALSKYITTVGGRRTINWDTFLSDISKEGGVTVPYHPYGIEGEDSNLVITLTKVIANGEKDETQSPHDTEVVGNGVEQYKLTVKYNPDYNHVLPHGQGGTGSMTNADFHTGTYGSLYQGHATGRETSENNHKINVFAPELKVLKTDESGKKLADATFSLYRKDEQNGTTVEGLDGKYVTVAQGTSNAQGIAALTPLQGKVLSAGTYYLVENTPPTGYVKDSSVYTVTIENESVYTDIDGNSISGKAYPFNWEESVRLRIDGNAVTAHTTTTVESTEIVGGEEQTVVREIENTVTDGSFINMKNTTVEFSTTIVNKEDKASITVSKAWDTTETHPSSINVELYRVSEVGHQLVYIGTTSSTCTEEGVKIYRCKICGEEKTEAISPAGHKPGEAVIEPHPNGGANGNCEHESGCYDAVRYCTVCGAEVSREHHPDHTWGEAQEEESTDPTKCYDTVVRCTVCGAEKDGSRIHHEHDWGDEATNPYIVTKEPTTSSTGIETQHCLKNDEHTRDRTIPKLPAKTKITYRVYDFWYYDQDPNHEWYHQNLYYKNYNSGNDIVTGDQFDIGSTVRVTWTDTNRYDAYYHINGNAQSRSQYPYGTWYWFPDQIPSRVSRDGNYTSYTYSFDFVVTNNMRLDILLGYYIDPRDFTFTTIAPAPSTTNQNSAGNKMLFSARFVQTPKLMGRNAQSGNLSPILAGTPNAAGMTAEQLMTYLNSVPDTASCKSGENHMYKEKVSGTYEVNATGNWTLKIDDLDKYNAYGNSYTYYVVEKTEGLIGYDVIYTGQDNGLQDNGEMTITNRHVNVDITIKKVVDETEIPLEGVEFTLTPVDDRGNVDTNRIVNEPTKTTESDGSIIFEGLAPGRYKLEEGTPIAGYLVTEGPYYINVTADATDSVDNIASFEHIEVDGHVFTIENEPGAALPATGGPGTNLIYFLGIILTSLAGAGLMMRKRGKM